MVVDDVTAWVCVRACCVVRLKGRTETSGIKPRGLFLSFRAEVPEELVARQVIRSLTASSRHAPADLNKSLVTSPAAFWGCNSSGALPNTALRQV